jgi:uncharacterized ubiquitin-like protein YukD
MEKLKLMIRYIHKHRKKGRREIMEELVQTEKLEIFVDTARGSLKVELPQNATVKDVISAVLQKFSLTAQEVYELVHEGAPLKPERTIQSYQIKSGDHLTLVRETLVG